MNLLNKFLLPPEKTAHAVEVDKIFNFINVSSLILLAGIVVAILYFVIKYRRKSENDMPPVIRENVKLEITWTVVPMILVFFIFGWGFQSFMKIHTPPDNTYEIHVTGQQWLWRFTYPNGATSTGDLHVPVNRPVKLIMESNDVIHSFFVPDFRIKQDVLPNRYTELWFNVKETGESDLFCAEYCGTGHSDMTGKVIAQSEDDFQNWLASAKSPQKNSNMSPAEYGKQLVQQNACLTCHSLDGSEKVGPTWKGLWGRTVTLSNGNTLKADADYIHESIVDPKAKVVEGFNPVMPSFKGQLNDDQINAIIQFIKQQ